MKRLFIILIAATLMLSISGCKQDTKKQNDKNIAASNTAANKGTSTENKAENEIITIGWEYYMFSSKDYDIPNTVVYLSVQSKEEGKKHYKIGTFVGELYDVTEQDCLWNLPEGSLINCYGWYGGAGDILGIVKSGDNKLIVKHKSIEDAGGDENLANEIEKRKYEDKLIIDIKEKIEIKTISGVKLDKDYEN